MRTLNPNKAKDEENISLETASKLQSQIDAINRTIHDLQNEVDLNEYELDNYKQDNLSAFSTGTLSATDTTTSDLHATEADIGTLDVNNLNSANIENSGIIRTDRLDAESGSVKELSGTNANFTNDVKAHKVWADEMSVSSYNVENEYIENATIDTADISDVNIGSADVENLSADEATITEITSEEITSTSASISRLSADNSEIEGLVIKKNLIADKEQYGYQQIVNNTQVWIKIPVVNTGRYLLQVYNTDMSEWFFGVNISFAGNDNATIQYSEKSWEEEPQYLGNNVYLHEGHLYFQCRQYASRILWKYETSKDDLFDAPQTSFNLPIDPLEAEVFKIKKDKGTIFTRYVQIGTDGGTGILTLSPTSWLASDDQAKQYDTTEDVDFGFYAPNQDLDKGASPEFHTIQLDTDGKTVARLNNDGILFAQDPATVVDSGAESGTLIPEEKLVEADDLYRYNGNSYPVVYNETSGTFYKVDTDGTLPYIATVDNGTGVAKGDYCVLENDQSVPTWNPSLGNNLELQNTTYSSVFYGIERVGSYTPSDYGTLKETKQFTFGTLVESGSKVPIKITGPEMYYNGGTYPKFYNIFWDSGFGGTGYRKFATASGYGTKDFNPDVSTINQTENVNDVLTYIQNFGTQINLYNTLNAYIISDGYNNKYYLTGTLITSAGTHSIPVVNGGQGWDTFAEAVEAFRTGDYTLYLSNKSFTFSSVAYWAMVETNEDLYYTNYSYSYNSFISTKPSDFYYFVGNITEYIYEHSETINKPNGYFIKSYPNKTNDMELLNPDTTAKRFLKYNNNNYVVTYTDFGGGPYRYTFKDMNLGTGSCITGITGLDTVTIQYKSDGSIDWTRNIPDGFVVPATKSKMDEYIQISNTYTKVGEKIIDYTSTDHPITNLGNGTVVHGTATIGTDLTVRKDTVLGSAEGTIDPDTGDPIHTNTEVKGDLTVGTTASDSFTAKSIAYFENGYEVGSVQEPRHAHHYGDIYRYNFDTNTDEEINATYQRVDEKGLANGYAPLDANARIPRQHMPYDVMEYRGSWDASTGVFPQGTAQDPLQVGDTYKVSVAGTIDGQYYGVNDEITYNGNGWDYYENNKVILGTTDLGVVGCMWLA